MDFTTTCPICQAQPTRTAEHAIGFQEGLTYDLYECNSCKASYATPLSVDDSIYNLIYKNANNITGYSRYNELSQLVLIQKDPMRFLSDSSDICWSINSHFYSGAIKTSHKVLEVGSGLGYRTYSLVKMGYNVKGVDISQEAVDKATKLYGNHFICADINEMAEVPSHRYDSIIMAEVIEHIPDIHKFMSSLYRMLEPGGKLFLTTPNKDAFPNGTIWNTTPPPVHLFWLTEKSMLETGKRLNAKVSFLDFSDYNKFHFDTAKLFPSAVKGTSFFSKDGKLLVTSKNPFYVKFAYFLLDKFPAVLNMISFVLMFPYRKRHDWKRRHFMCVEFQKPSL